MSSIKHHGLNSPPCLPQRTGSRRRMRRRLRHDNCIPPFPATRDQQRCRHLPTTDNHLHAGDRMQGQVPRQRADPRRIRPRLRPGHRRPSGVRTPGRDYVAGAAGWAVGTAGDTRPLV